MDMKGEDNVEEIDINDIAVEDMNLVSGDWTKLDSENQVTELTFSSNGEFIAKITFDLKNDEIKTEGDLSKITGLQNNDEFIQQYKESSEEIIKIV